MFHILLRRLREETEDRRRAYSLWCSLGGVRFFFAFSLARWKKCRYNLAQHMQEGLNVILILTVFSFRHSKYKIPASFNDEIPLSWQKSPYATTWLPAGQHGKLMTRDYCGGGRNRPKRHSPHFSLQNFRTESSKNVLSDFLLEFRLELQWVNEWTFIQAIPYLWTVIIIPTPNPPLEMKCVNLKTRLAHVAQKINMADNFQYKIFLLQSKHVK